MMASRLSLVLLYLYLYHLNLLCYILLYLILSRLILFSWLSTLLFFPDPWVTVSQSLFSPVVLHCLLPPYVEMAGVKRKPHGPEVPSKRSRPDEVWKGVIVEDGQNEQSLVRKFSTMGRVTVNANRRLVANEKGHMLFGSMEQLAEEVSGLKRWKEESERWKEESESWRTQNDKRILDLETRILPLKTIRERILDEASGYRDSENISVRNECAHGGHVLEDILLINEESATDRQRAEYWGRAFRNLYGCRITTVEKHLRTAPPEMIQILNINANCNLLKKWESNPNTKTQILQSCNNLLNEWLFSHPPDFLQHDSPSHNEYKKVIEKCRSTLLHNSRENC